MSDATIELHGSITQIICESDAAKDWIEDHCAPEGWQWMGNRLCVEPRYVMPIVEAMIEDGLEVNLPQVA
jgi:hypothetical protein